MLQIPKPQLILPRADNLPATPAATSVGTTVTASGSVNTKGAWVEMYAAAAVTSDIYGITILINMDFGSGVVTKNLYDIGVGGAGSETVKVPNILHTGSSNLTTGIREIFIPIFIPKGTRISMRKQSNVASKTASIIMFLFGAGGLAPWPTFSGVDSYGTDVTTSGGVAHAFGSTGTYSTWANIGATLSKDYGAVLPLLASGSDTTMTAQMGYMDLGVNSVTFAKYCFSVNAAETISNLFPSTPLYHKFASGTQLMFRGTMTGAPDTDEEIGFLAFY